MAELKIISMDEVEVKPVSWLWYPYIPYGKITIVQGDPGEGKTTIALRIAALLSRGEKLPSDDTEHEPTVVIYQTAEDGLDDTVKPRLIEADADCTMIKVIDESDKALSMLDERIEQAIIKENAKVLILDPIQAYVGKDVNMNCANEIRDVMKNIGISAAKLKWIGHYDITLDDPLNGFVNDNKSVLAERLIKECLAGGQAPQSEIVKKAKSQDISKRILDEAKKNLGVKSKRINNQWYWELPTEE